MKGIIQLLPDHIANQIAAGEVIQRPASVVKELVENAIDAGATKIQIYIKDAGRTSIQIIDNGNGMNNSDALMCFERHATSKVRTADDLFTLQTKGFRGEALASIAAISHVTLRTKQPDAETGIRIEMEGSKIKMNEPCVCSSGTSFEIKNLFFNVPARRNFLKSDNVEFGHIRDEFERIALAHPSIAFTIKHNDTEIYNLNPGVLRKRIVDILGRNSNDKLVPIEETTDIVALHGYVGKPEFAKKSRGEQFLFVNDRYFRDSYFTHAITRAFEGLLPSKHFPSFFLYMTVNPAKIDVNVHPTKTEIKFEEDKLIYAILLSSIRQALGKYNISPTLDFDRETSFDLPAYMKDQPPVEPVVQVNPHFNPFRTSSTVPGRNSGGNQFTSAIKAEGFGNTSIEKNDWDAFYKIEDVETIQPTPLIEDQETSFESNHFLFSGRHILTNASSGFMLIDTYRAYERIVYDDLMKKFISNPIASQQLLFPIEKQVTKSDRSAWESNETLLKRFGFSWQFESDTLQLNAVPSILQEESIQDCIEGILERIAYQTIDKGEIAHAVILSIATSAGKRQKITNNESARLLLEQLMRSEEQLSPEGKRVISYLSTEEISNRF